MPKSLPYAVCTQRTHPRSGPLPERPGRIDILVNNAGISESTPFTQYTEEAFDKVMDLNAKGVFNAVAPGITETDRMKALPKEVIEPMIARIPLRRLGRSEDVANTFVFPASEEASCITGVLLSADGRASA